MSARASWVRVSLAALALAGCQAQSASEDSVEQEAVAEPMPASPAPMVEEQAKEMEAGGLSLRGVGMGGGAINPGSEGTIGLGNIGTIGHGAGGGALQPPASEAEAPPPTMRTWFPETFLFAPLVETDAQGMATHKVRVPDRLTTWRVLALAHSRNGTQAGAETTFLGTLPAYVELIVPSFLGVGDVAQIPIQVVNTTQVSSTLDLTVHAEGAAMAQTSARVQLQGGASQVVYATVSPLKPGTLALEARLGSDDAVRRTVPVIPLGQPVEATRAGTLAAPRTFELVLPSGLEPLGSEARLRVFPGALALLRSEVMAATARGSDLGDAYTLLVASRGRALLGKLSAQASRDLTERLRTMSIVATQRVVRAARAPDVFTAAFLSEAALAHPDNPVLARLGERLLTQIEQAQRPDGTFGGGDGTNLQQLLVGTADCVRAVNAAKATPAARQRAARVSAKAGVAFARHLARIDDGYTAAAVLASGAVIGADADQLRQLVREAVREDADGGRSLPVSDSARRGDGSRPSAVEAMALAVLALGDDAESSAAASELGNRILSSYTPTQGFGDGRTNVAALGAILALFSGELPERIAIQLLQDGKLVTEQSFARADLTDTLLLSAPLEQADGSHRYEVRAEPAVPGLGFHLTAQGFAPWTKGAAGTGLELSITLVGKPRVGQPLEVALQAAAPAGHDVEIVHHLPAGVQVDEPSLEALLSAATIRSFDAHDGSVTLRLSQRSGGMAFTARYRVIPTLAGTLGAPAASIRAGDITQQLAPARWVVAR